MGDGLLGLLSVPVHKPAAKHQEKWKEEEFVTALSQRMEANNVKESQQMNKIVVSILVKRLKMENGVNGQSGAAVHKHAMEEKNQEKENATIQHHLEGEQTVKGNQVRLRPVRREPRASHQ